MPERVREVTIVVYVDTNKNTYSEVFDDVEPARNYLETLCDDLFPELLQQEINKIKWISVKDSEPPDETWVLGTNGRDIECVFKHFTDCYSMTTITHWMPLPKSPKEEK